MEAKDLTTTASAVCNTRILTLIKCMLQIRERWLKSDFVYLELLHPFYVTSSASCNRTQLLQTKAFNFSFLIWINMPSLVHALKAQPIS